MTWLIAPAVVAVLLLVVVRVKPRQAQPSPNPEALTEAAIELHRIRRRLDVAWTRTEQRQDTARLRREIAETLRGHDDRP